MKLLHCLTESSRKCMVHFLMIVLCEIKVALIMTGESFQRLRLFVRYLSGIYFRDREKRVNLRLAKPVSMVSPRLDIFSTLGAPTVNG